MADDKKPGTLDVETLFDDVLKVSGSASQFGPLRIYRVPEQPSDDFGRNGDLAVIDNTAESTTEIAIDRIPTNVAFCQKVPINVPSDATRTTGTVNGADLTPGDQFTVNGITVTLPAGTIFTQDAADEINAAAIDGITAGYTKTNVVSSIVNPVALPGDSLLINGVLVTYPTGGDLGKIIAGIRNASIPFLNVAEVTGKISFSHDRGGVLTIGGASAATLLGPLTNYRGQLFIDNAAGTSITLVDVIGTPIATMGVPDAAASAPTLGGTWVCFGQSDITVKDHGVVLGTFDILDFEGAGVTLADVGGEAVITVSGGGDPDQNLIETFAGDAGSYTAATTTDTLNIVGAGTVSTAVVGNTMTVTGVAGAAQNIWLTIAGDGGSVSATSPIDTLTIAGGTGISTSMAGTTLTVTNTAPNVDQNLVDTFTGDIGSFTATTTTDTFNIVGAGTVSTAVVGNTITITGTGGGGSQNLWETITSDSGSAVASIPTDTLTIAGGTSISTAIVGDTLTITNDAPNVDQNLFETVVGNAGSTTADTTTDTLTIVGTGVISTAVVGDTLTISSSGAADQNLVETFTGDAGSFTATTPTDTLNIVGAGTVSTAVVGNTMTITGVGGAGQNLWETITSDSGSAVANTPTDTLNILGAGTVSTAIVGDTLTITGVGGAGQNLWETITSDAGSAVASIPTDTLTIAGGTGVSTAIAGDTLTITNDSPNVDQNLWLTIQDDAASTIAAGTTTATLTVAGAGGITTSVSGTTLTITSSGGQTFTDTREPTGFVNRTDSVISFSDVAPRQFTIAVLAPALQYEYYIHGVKYTETTTKNITIPSVDGVHFLYFDNTQTLQTTTVFTDALILDNALVAYVYWNSATITSTIFGEERHGITMDGETHLHLHLSLGCQFVTGLLVNGTLNPDVASPIDADVQVDVSTGTIRDEDLSHNIVDNGGKVNVFDLEQNISPIAQIPVLYRLGVSGLWYIKAADNFPFIYSGDSTGYVGGANGLPPWNEFTGGSWQLTETGNNSFFFVHIFASNDIRNPIVAIQGISTYTNKPAGRVAAAVELSQLAGLPFLEFTPLVTLIAEAKSSYTNTPKIRFRTTENGEDYVDWRNQTSFGSSGGGVIQNTYASVTDGVNIATAALPNDILTLTGTGGITTTVSSAPDTITIDGSVIVTASVLNASTGTLTGGLLTINGGDATQFDIAAGTGQIVDHATNPLAPTIQTVTWGAIIATTAVNIGVSDATGVFIDSGGSVVQLPIIGSNIDHKDKIFIGQLGHAQPSVVIQAARNNNDPVHGPAERVGDLSRALGPFNVLGNIYGPNGVNLNLNKTTGDSYSVGINFQNTLENPDVSADPALAALSFRYGHLDGIGGFTTLASGIAVDPANYDDGSGALVAVPPNRWTCQMAFWFPGANETRIEYGQFIFLTAQAALNILPDPRHQSNPVFAGVGVLRAFLVLRADAVDLTDPTKAIIVEGAKFGAGAGGQFSNSITDLQQAYDNSVTPEIVTDSTRGALSVTEGTAVGGNLFEGNDDTATQVFAVDTAGDVTISGSGAKMAVTTINSQPILTLEDTTRANKILSVAEQELVFSNSTLTDLGWMSIGSASDALSGYIASLQGTLVFASYHCSEDGGNAKELDLYINGVLNTTIFTLPGATGPSSATATTLNIDFSQGDRIQMRAGTTGGTVQDTIVTLSVRWRA